MENATEIFKKLDWMKELRAPGMPDPTPVYTNPKIEDARSLANEYIKKNGSSPENPGRYKQYYSQLKIIFMIELTKKNASGAVVAAVDKDLNVTLDENNPEILLYWLSLNIPKRFQFVKFKTDVYVGSYGRSKYLLPTYRHLSVVDKEYGRQLFKKYGANYNPKVADMISAILK